MSNKIFDLWSTEKKRLNVRNTSNVYINQREIWFTKMGKNIGFEQDGKTEFNRPVLVLKKVGNLFLTAALTTKGKEENRFFHKFKNATFEEEHKANTKNSYVVLSQIKVMDKKRFEEKIGLADKNEFEHIKQKLKALLL